MKSEERNSEMRPPSIDLVAAIAAAGYCGYWLMGAFRKGYFRGSRLYGHRYHYRQKEPGLYWANVILMTIFFALALLAARWVLISPRTFR